MMSPVVRIFLWTMFVYEVIMAEQDFVTCEESVPMEIFKEIASYRPIANEIINAVIHGDFKGKAYEDLAVFVDKFGPRLTGSATLEHSIDYLIKKFKHLNFENVHGEQVSIPHWIRGNESVTLLKPRFEPLIMKGIGRSVPTPPNGITAEAVVFDSFEEMEKHASEIRDKIVIFNEDFDSYANKAQYRTDSASKASRFGAVAVLVASITPISIGIPHTGNIHYTNDTKKIPAACLTPAATKMLSRRYKRGEKLVIHFQMENKLLPNAISRNIIADLRGTTYRNQSVIVSGHIDSWDVGEGALDDGGGAFISWKATEVLIKLGLRAKRTIRTILWTAEEQGYIGAIAYRNSHDLAKINFILESDLGTFKPYGLDFAGNDVAACIIQEILRLLSGISATTLQRHKEVGSDLSQITKLGVPGASLLNENQRYYWYHHTEADTMDVLDPHELDLCTALMAVVAYVVADLSIDIPKTLLYDELKRFRKRHII